MRIQNDNYRKNNVNNCFFFICLLQTYGMEIFYLTKITEVQINDTINKYIMNMSGDYT